MTRVEAPGQPGGVLFKFSDDADSLPTRQPDHFVDLGLDQIVGAATAGREEYDLAPFFWRPLTTVAAVEHRHDVVADLQHSGLTSDLGAFAEAMRTVRLDLARAEKHEHPLQKQRWRLDAENRYWTALAKLDEALRAQELRSEALLAFRDHLTSVLASDLARQRTVEGVGIAAALSKMRYDIIIDGLRVQVRLPEGEKDYGAAVEATFAAFESTTNRDFEFELATSLHVNRIEGEVLSLIGAVEPETFGRLEKYAAEEDFVDDGVRRFDREIQFYLGYLEHVRRVGGTGLSFCLPRLSTNPATVQAHDAFDLALANNLAATGAIPVTNDVELRTPERVIVVTGPNQGGKTTFARLIGQLHYLAALGLPAPARAADLALCDRIFTHFERAERMTSLRGKLQDDLVRIHRILEKATSRSLIIVNELFASTTLRDALWLSREVAGRVLVLGALCVWVTFIEEVADLDPKVVSMVSAVSADDPSVRTFRISRGSPSGLAHALSIAERHRLTYAALGKRLRR